MFRERMLKEDEWDPMKDAFYSEKFNSYQEGPGAYLDRALQPCFRKRNSLQRPLCKLYVHKIPAGLSEEAVRNMFLKFSNPVSVYVCRKPNSADLNWGFVEYATISEGQEAINELNGRPPAYLGVQFARSDEEKERMRREYEEGHLLTKICGSYDASYDLPEMESPYPRAIGRGRGIPLFPQATVHEIYSQGCSSALGHHDPRSYVTDEDEIVFRKHIPRGVFTPYRGSMWDPSNDHIMGDVSLTVNSSEDGRRISMGRAVNSSYVESRPKIRRHAYALQESKLCKNSFRIGYCAYCEGPSKFICGRCGTWYCSQNCQQEDWLQHKAKCLLFDGHPYKLEKGKGGVRQGHLDSDLQKEGRTLGMADVESDEEQRCHSSGSKRNSQQNNRLKRDNIDGMFNDSGLSDENFPRRTSRVKTADSNVKDYQKSQGYNLRRKDVEMSSERKRENDERREPRLHESRRDNVNGRSWEREQEDTDAKIRVPNKFQGFNQRMKDAETNNFQKGEAEERRGSSLHERPRRSNNANESREMNHDSTEAKSREGQQKFQDFSQRSKDAEGGCSDRMKEGNERRGRPSQEIRKKGNDVDECWKSRQSNQSAIGRDCEAGKGRSEERVEEKIGEKDKERGTEGVKDWGNERRGGGGYERRGNGGRGRGRGGRGVRGGRDAGYRQRGDAFGGSKPQRSPSDNSSPTCGTPDEDWDADKPVVQPTTPARTSENAARSKETIDSSCLYNQHVKLTPGKFTEVEIGTVVSPGHFWVQSSENKQDLISILKIMRENWHPSGKPFEPKVGDYCTALFEEFPFRARVLSVGNIKAKVFFVDFGNTDMCELVNMGELPLNARNYKSQVIEVVIADGTPAELLKLSANSVIRIKPVGKKESGAVIVQVEGVNYKEIRPSSSGMSTADSKRADSVINQDGANSQPLAHSNGKMVQWPKSVVKLLEEGELAACEVYAIEMKDGARDSAILGIAFQGIRKEIAFVLEKFHEECLQMPKYPKYRPSVGELIAAFDDDGRWKRAVVIDEESSGWVVAFCDAGMVKTLKEIQEMPKDRRFHEAPAIAAKCSIVKFLVPRDELFSEGKMKVGSKLQLNIVARNGDYVVADVSTVSQSVFCKAKLEEWIPQGPDPKCVVLTNGDKVQIVSYYNLAAVYVQPIDEESKKNIQRLLQDVSGACMPIGGMKTLKEVPPTGTIVGCKFTGDDNFYRALITDVKSPKEICVSYIDFGNQESVPLERIHDLPYELRKIPSYAVKIGLKTSNVTQLTKEAATLLHELVLENAELKFVCPDDDLRSCELYTKSGTNLNEKLNKMLEAKQSSSDSSGTSDAKPIKMSSLIEEKLPKPPQGEDITIKFLILNCPGRCTVIGCLAEDPRIRLVYESLSNDLSEHCEKCPNEPYVPTQFEMCIAKFTDGMWYRAFAIDSKRDETSLYFVDFGNWMKVNHKDIRKMVSEFMKVPVLATLCSYKGFEENTMTTEQEKRLQELLKPNSVATARVWYNSETDDYILDIPEVTKTLKAENLLPHTV